MVVASFLFFLAFFFLVGIASTFRSRKSASDYYLASRKVSPWMTALSAVSTTCSGFMFIGLIGISYSGGVSSFWIWGGLVSGNFLAWNFLFRKFRILSAAKRSSTYPAFLASGHDGMSLLIRRLTGLITIVFLGSYAAAQLSAGGKALHAIFGWDYNTGIFIGSCIVLSYCLAGGIRASIWTDSVQALVMLVAMAVLSFYCLSLIGGWKALMERLASLDPALVSYTPSGESGSGILFALSWFATGLGVVGQPHIMVRAMAIESGSSMRKAQKIYFIYYTAFVFMAVLAGLCCRALIPTEGLFDPELALPVLAGRYFPELFVGIILAGIFASTMSTADSQILACSASLSLDLKPRGSQCVTGARSSTFLVTICVLLVALLANESVFQLVLMSWSALCASLAPLFLIRTMEVSLSPASAAAMVVSGLLTALFWRYLGLHDHLSEAVPGALVSFLSFGVSRSEYLKRGRSVSGRLGDQGFS